tara:strand:+ start:43371 stop:44588 length:1218 start_codon:yes stop_codon:yes gene_type:complete
VISILGRWRKNFGLPPIAREILKEDYRGVLRNDPGADFAIDLMVDWLCRAQDNSASADGGVARDFSLTKGWATSYPETTGYIIPTMLNVAELRQREELRDRARRMLDWCRKIQLDCGGFQGGKIDASPVVPVTFNTGQILLGLAAGVAAFDDYRDTMHKAASFLRDSQDEDGAWRRHPTPFAQPGDKAYETHVAWGLFEADRIAPDEGYGEAGMRQVRWAMGLQQANGWVDKCCLNMPRTPLTHTLGYYLKGLVEAHRWSNDEAVLNAALRTAEGLLGTLRPDGFLPGRLAADWTPAASWTCLTGNVQIADSWLYLAEVANTPELGKAARTVIAKVRRTLRMDAPDSIRGGVQGSYPINGDYGEMEYLNWAAKFSIDANLSELSSGQKPRKPLTSGYRNKCDLAS